MLFLSLCRSEFLTYIISLLSEELLTFLTRQMNLQTFLLLVPSPLNSCFSEEVFLFLSVFSISFIVFGYLCFSCLLISTIFSFLYSLIYLVIQVSKYLLSSYKCSRHYARHWWRSREQTNALLGWNIVVGKIRYKQIHI